MSVTGESKDYRTVTTHHASQGLGSHLPKFLDVVLVNHPNLVL